MTKIIQTTTLMVVLSVCAQAGIIQNGSPAPTPPPPATTSMTQDETEMETLAEGIMQTDLADAASQAALASLQSLLTLF